ncbi:MAG: twin transmembrane helix small protein [Nitrosomonas sp.]|nr:twin transmembrane helix small protein [Nitrosomonas sp.]
MKIFAILLILLILYSLGSALYYMYKDEGKSTRMVKALSWRIGLSLVLFIIMMLITWLNLEQS